MTPRTVCTTLFFFNDTAPTEIYTLSLHGALPILRVGRLTHDLPAARIEGGSDGAPRVIPLRDQNATTKTPIVNRLLKIGRAHVRTPVTATSRMPSSA